MVSLFGIVIVLAILAPLVGYSVYTARIAGKITSSRQFFIHTGKLNLKDLSRSFAASWMALSNVIVALLVISLIAGIANLWIVLTWGLGFVIFARHTLQIKHLCRQDDTLHSFLGRRFDMSALRIAASVFTIAAGLGIIALELIVGIALLQAIPGVPQSFWTPVIGSVVLTLALAFYTSRGGFFAVIRTDRTQFLLIVLAVIAMMFLVISHLLNNPELADQIPRFLWKPSSLGDWGSLWAASGIAFLLGNLLLNFFIQVGDMGSWQRVIAAKDSNVASVSLKRVALWMIIIWTAIMATGIMLWSHPNPEGLFPNPNAILSTQAEPLPSLLKLGSSSVVGIIAAGLVTAGVASAMLSTADTYIVVIMQTLAQDIVFFRKRKEQGDDKQLDRKILSFSRRYLYVVAFLGLALFWVLIPLGFDLLTLVFIIMGSQCVLAPLAVVAMREDIEPRRYAFPAFLSAIIAFALVYVFGYLAALKGQLSFAYWAPFAAVTIPTLVLTVAGMEIDKLKPLWLIKSMLFGRYPQADQLSTDRQ